MIDNAHFEKGKPTVPGVYRVFYPEEADIDKAVDVVRLCRDGKGHLWVEYFGSENEDYDIPDNCLWSRIDLTSDLSITGIIKTNND